MRSTKMVTTPVLVVAVVPPPAPAALPPLVLVPLPLGVVSLQFANLPTLSSLGAVKRPTVLDCSWAPVRITFSEGNGKSPR